MVGGCSKDSVFFLELFVGVVQMFIDSLFRATRFPKLIVWMIFKSENDQRTTHFALTSPSHHQSGLKWSYPLFRKQKSGLHHFHQPRSQVAHFSLRARNFSVCRSTQRALVPSVLCELTLPAVPTPSLPEPGEEVVRQS